MESSVSQGAAVRRRRKARKIEGIKLAFLPWLRGISAVKLAWQTRDAGITVRDALSVTLRGIGSELRDDGLDHEQSRGTANDIKQPLADIFDASILSMR
jgi:hypothetical protein